MIAPKIRKLEKSLGMPFKEMDDAVFSFIIWPGLLLLFWTLIDRRDNAPSSLEISIFWILAIAAFYLLFANDKRSAFRENYPIYSFIFWTICAAFLWKTLALALDHYVGFISPTWRYIVDDDDAERMQTYRHSTAAIIGFLFTLVFSMIVKAVTSTHEEDRQLRIRTDELKATNERLEAQLAQQCPKKKPSRA